MFFKGHMQRMESTSFFFAPRGVDRKFIFLFSDGAYSQLSKLLGEDKFTKHLHPHSPQVVSCGTYREVNQRLVRREIINAWDDGKDVQIAGISPRTAPPPAHNGRVFETQVGAQQSNVRGRKAPQNQGQDATVGASVSASVSELESAQGRKAPQNQGQNATVSASVSASVSELERVSAVVSESASGSEGTSGSAGSSDSATIDGAGSSNILGDVGSESNNTTLETIHESNGSTSENGSGGVTGQFSTYAQAARRGTQNTSTSSSSVNLGSGSPEYEWHLHPRKPRQENNTKRLRNRKRKHITRTESNRMLSRSSRADSSERLSKRHRVDRTKLKPYSSSVNSENQMTSSSPTTESANTDLETQPMDVVEPPGSDQEISNQTDRDGGGQQDVVSAANGSVMSPDLLQQ